MKAIALLIVSAITLAPTEGRPQQTVSPSSLLVPSPMSLVLTIGRWIVSSSDQPKVYYIRVEGRGVTEGDARNEAYKRAVQEAIGSLVVSESQVVNDELRRREILEYSSGYVDRFKVLGQRHDGRHWIMDMEVWVKHSAIADRVLNQTSNTFQFDGARIESQVNTLNHERTQGDRVLNLVLADYPQKAYDIKNLTTQAQFNANRSLDVVLQFDMRLNDRYVYSLWEALKTVSQGSYAGRCVPSCNGTFTVQMEGKRDQALFADWAYTMVFHDGDRSRQFSRALIEGFPMIQVTLKDGAGIPVHRTCHHYAHNRFVSMRDNYALIENNAPLQNRIEIRDIRGISQVKSIDLAVVRQQTCSGQ